MPPSSPFEETWPIATVIPPIGGFTCFTLDASGAWVPADGQTIPVISLGSDIGLKATCPLDAGGDIGSFLPIPMPIDFMVRTKMVFTFTSPSGRTVVVTKKAKDSVLFQLPGGHVSEEARITPDEVGIWSCTVNYYVSSALFTEHLVGTWGPFATTKIVGPGDDDYVPPPTTPSLTDAQKKALLIAGGVAAAVVLLKRD